MEMVAGEEGLGPRASVSNVVNKDSSSRSAGGRGRWVLRRTVVQVAVLVGALTLLSPATGLQALKPEGRMAFLSRTIIQSFIHRLNRKHHDAGENHPPNLCHKTDGVCRSRGAFQTRSTTRSASATPMQGHSSLACGGMCAPNDSQAVSSQEGGEAPPATIPRRSESDPALHMRLRRGDADSLVAPRTQSPPMRRADGEDAACDAALPDMADITWEEDGEGMDPLEMLQSNATLDATGAR
ncbi:hypothetical protein T484DRAFT_1805480 [Baffinella frigidus]|nr:hypothetical protein T484DRAFT_1805480 [Cryptophyta sp. CCMP2293]